MKKKLKAESLLGNIYSSGEYIVRQGEAGDLMYEIQDGKVEVLIEDDGREIHIGSLGRGDFFGEMALFERSNRSASVRASGEARVLTIDKKIFFGRVAEDPSLAFRILEKMSNRIRRLDQELIELKKKVEILNSKS